jgi:hypothetical protein
MPSVGRTLALDHPLYGMAKLIDTGATFCGMRARFHPALNAISIGQFALSLRALFRNREWLETHVLKDG